MALGGIEELRDGEVMRNKRFLVWYCKNLPGGLLVLWDGRGGLTMNAL